MYILLYLPKVKAEVDRKRQAEAFILLYPEVETLYGSGNTARHFARLVVNML